jgi:hypothetical protein
MILVISMPRLYQSQLASKSHDRLSEREKSGGPREIGQMHIDEVEGLSPVSHELGQLGVTVASQQLNRVG